MPPVDFQSMMAALAGAAGAPAGGPGGPPLGIPPGGMPGMGGPGPAGGMMGLPGPMNETAQMGLSALDRLTNREPNGGLAVDQVRRALELAQKLIVASLPMVSQWNAKMSKDLHVIGRQIADARINLTKEEEPGPPPESLIMGIQGTGLPTAF